MTPDELIQLMRTCSMAQVRAQIEALHKEGSIRSDMDIGVIEKFYTAAAKRKP